MRFLISFLLIAVFSFVACMYFPWWSIAIVGFLIAVIIPQKPIKMFLCGFFSLFVLWAGLSFWMSSLNDNILAHKLSLLIFKMDSPFLLIIVTGLIGGAVAGFAALSGSFISYKPNRV